MMDLWKLCVLLLTAQLSEICRAKAPDVKDSNDLLLRKTLEKEILKHTIQFLRNKLVRCLKASPGSQRQKRKSGGRILWMLEHDLDMDLMGRTKDYLMTRIVDCRGQGASNYGGSDAAGRRDRVIIPAQHLSTTTIRATTGGGGGGGVEAAAGRAEPHPPRTPAPEAQSQATRRPPEVGGDVRGVPKAILAATPLQVTTKQPAIEREHTFIISGRQVSCKHMTISDDQKTLYCGDVWIDKKYRLPNSDLCLPRFGTEPIWRHLKHIHKGTFRVLDLEGFCQALGDASNIPGYVENLKVSWDCGANETRIKWLHDQWAGTTVDNGFLHDLQCSFDTFT